jgi:hypothetical protein
VGLEFELPCQAGSNGCDAFGGLESDAFVGDESGLKSTDWNRCFVDHVDDDQHDVLVVVIDVHADRCEMSVQGAGAGAMVVAHRCSPVRTDG